MFLNTFHHIENQILTISTDQASQFAKSVADDFNPIHDVDAKRFCVPGDLLFALIVSHYGLHRSMCFSFEGMVGKGVELNFPASISNEFTLTDQKDKAYLSLTKSGDSVDQQDKIEQFVRAYVAFSGHNFVDILVPLMRQHNVMINPARPLVIYENMSFELSSLSFERIRLELDNSELQINGKRGDVALSFNLYDELNELIGHGRKSLILSALRELDEQSIQAMLTEYDQRKSRF